MEKLNPTLAHLLEKLLITKQMYEKASSVVHNSPMTVLFEKTAEKRDKFIDGLCGNLAIEKKDLHVSLAKQLKVSVEKLGMDFNDAMVHRNELYVLNFCISYDEQLAENYREILETGEQNKAVSDVALFQLNDVKSNLAMLRQKAEAYDFEHMES